MNFKEKGQHVENLERHEQCWYEVGRGDWGRQSEADAMAYKDLLRWQVVRASVVEWTVDKSSQFKIDFFAELQANEVNLELRWCW